MSKLRLCEPYKINQRLDRDQHLVSYTLGSLQGTTLSWQQRYTKEASKSKKEIKAVQAPKIQNYRPGPVFATDHKKDPHHGAFGLCSNNGDK